MGTGDRRAGGLVGAATGAAREVASTVRSKASGGIVAAHDDPARWRAVTIALPVAEVAPDGAVPSALAELAPAVEVVVRPAPGDKGTEVAARLRDPGAADAPQQLTAIRSALRECKQVLEVGEVLRLDPQPAGRRSDTPTGKLVEAAARRAGGEGLL